MLLLLSEISGGGIRSQGACGDSDGLNLSFSRDLGQRFSNFQVTILRVTLTDKVLLVHTKYL